MKKEYYYNYDIYCHEYFRGGVIDTDQEAYATSEDDLYDQVIEIVKYEYDFDYEDATEYGPIEVEINYTNDPKFKGTDKYMEDEEEE